MDCDEIISQAVADPHISPAPPSSAFRYRRSGSRRLLPLFFAARGIPIVSTPIAIEPVPALVQQAADAVAA
jgi:hypothetical protein